MSLPDEKYKALKLNRRFLEELCDPGRTPRVPLSVRNKARGILKHYPVEFELEQLADKCPEILDRITFSDKLYF